MPIILSKIGVCFTVLWALDPLEKAVYEFTQLKGIPGELRDASPDAWGRQYNRTHQLAELIAIAQAIEDGKPVPVHLLEQLDPGTSMGGARPKATIAVNRFRMVNPRVFGSVLHGTDRPGLAKALEMLREGATLAVYAELV